MTLGRAFEAPAEGDLESNRSFGTGAIESALKRAAAHAARQGEKWTMSRARVYELLLRAAGPVKAYDLIAAYDVERCAKPPTIYRALEFLEGLGLAHRIPSLSAYVACWGEGIVHATSFLICRSCGGAEEVSPGLAAIVMRTGKKHAFEPSAATLEIRGLCGRCR